MSEDERETIIYAHFGPTWGDMTQEEIEVRDIAADALREIDKLLEVVYAANRHFVAEGEMNAALHLSENVLPNPLAAKVALSLREGIGARQRLERRLTGERELPLEN